MVFSRLFGSQLLRLPFFALVLANLLGDLCLLGSLVLSLVSFVEELVQDGSVAEAEKVSLDVLNITSATING